MTKRLLPVIVVVLAMLIVPRALSQESDRELFREAERRFESGDYALAIDRYELLIREHPVSRYIADAQFRIGVALYQTGSPEQADARLARVATRYRSSGYLPYVPFWRGLIAYDRGDYGTSRTFFANFLGALVPEDSGGQPASLSAADRDIARQARLYSALAALELRDETATVADLEAMFALTDAPAGQGYPLALLLSLYAKRGEADRLLEFTADLDRDKVPAEWQPHLVLYEAEARFARGETDAAIAGYYASEDAPAELATLAFQRLFLLAQSGEIPEQPNDVLRRAEQALAGRTDVLAEFWLRVGIDAYNEGSFQVAELYLRRIWEFRERETIPASVPLYLSRLLDRRRETAAAEAILTEYLELNREAENEIRVLIGLGNLRVRLGRPEEALEPLARAVVLARDGDLAPSAAYQYAFARLEAGDAEGALTTLASIPLTGVGASDAQALRLRSVVLQRLGRREEALQTLFTYLPMRPADAAAAVEYVNLLFGLGREDRVVDEAPTILEVLSTNGSLTPAVEADLRYVLGLALLNRGQYGPAAEEMGEVVSRTSADTTTGVNELSRFYQGWALYRDAEYERAYDILSALAITRPESPRAAESAYLAGWSGFFAGNYDGAARQLARVGAGAAGAELAIPADFLLGRVLAAQGRYQEAAAQFRSLYLEEPGADLADDARFEYAEAQVSLGQTDAAAAGFADLVASHPESPLAEPAAYRRAEILFAAERYRDAQAAYFDYRTTFPNGDQLDAALFWGGVASSRLGEDAGATLLWERLASEFRGSSYRPEAIRRAAESHAARSNYREALNLYTEFRAAYPEEAESARVGREIDELVLLLNGLTEREAELFVTIEDSGGASSRNGRQAILELSRLAIYEDTAASTDGADVIPLLEDVAAESSSDPVIAAQATFMIAEYRNRQEELRQAAELYLEAASMGAADRDLAALSIYRAALMYSTLGRTSEVAALVAQLEDQFPSSEWLEEARSLQGGSNE